MCDVKMCRVCLSSGLKMYTYDQYYLSLFYEEVTAKKINNSDTLPHYFCYMCAAMLYKFHKFKEKCHRAERSLTELVTKGINLSSITQQYRQNKQIMTPIDIIIANKHVKTYLIKNKSTKPRKTSIQNIETIKMDSDAIDMSFKLDEQDGITDVLSEERDRDIRPDDKIKINENNQRKDVLLGIEDIILDEKPLMFDSDVKNTVFDNDDDRMSFDDDRMSVDKDNMSDDEFLSNLSLQKTDLRTSSNDKLILVRTDTLPDTLININEKNTKEKRLRKKKDKEGWKTKKQVQIKKRKQRKFETYSSRDNILDPRHWLKINLTEEEALEEYKAKANDRKYLAAAYKCTDCFKGFSKEDMLVRHRKLRHDEAVGSIICRFCSTRFKVKCKLSRHISQHYSKFKCLRCDLVCVLENTAQLHNESHNGVTRKCKHCGLEFRHLSTYYTHLRTHRSDHVCTLCGASFVSAVGLHKHRQSMHITDTNITQKVSIHCEQCDITFETRKAYDEHLIHSAMHSDGVEDLVDEKSTSSLRYSVKHRKRTFRTNPRKLSHCEICNKTFSTQVRYFNHHSTEHKGVPHPSKHSQTKVVCEVCGQTIGINSVKAHLNTHTREKMFTCATCGMQLVSKASLKRHQLTHTGEKPFECTLCDKRFTQKGSMQLHYRTFHLKEPYPKRNRRKKTDNDEIGLFDDYRNEVESENSSKTDRWRHLPLVL